MRHQDEGVHLPGHLHVRMWLKFLRHEGKGWLISCLRMKGCTCEVTWLLRPRVQGETRH